MDDFNNILQLPERCLLNKKITKAFFKRNFELTSGEKALLDDPNAVMQIEWLASVSPASANINLYSSEDYLYEEVQVITVHSEATNFKDSYFKIIDLVQKYIPYPVLLCIYNGNNFVLNTCDKKINKNDNTKRTIDKKYFTEIINIDDKSEEQKAFINSLGFATLDKTDLKTFYDSYTQRIVALQAAQISGSFIPRTQVRTQGDMANLEKIEALQKEITILQNQAQKETQLNQRIEMNTQIQLKRKQVEKLKELIIV